MMTEPIPLTMYVHPSRLAEAQRVMAGFTDPLMAVDLDRIREQLSPVGQQVFDILSLHDGWIASAVVSEKLGLSPKQFGSKVAEIGRVADFLGASNPVERSVRRIDGKLSRMLRLNTEFQVS